MFNDATASVLSSLGSISTDVFGALGLIILLSALGLSKGKSILFTLLVALYPSAFVTLFFPFYDSIQVGNNAMAKMFVPLSVFLLSTAILFAIFRRYINAGYQFHTFWRFVEVIVLSITITGFTIAILYHVVDVDTYYSFSSFFNMLFASPLSFFIWILAPLVSIPLFVRS